jgi:hypothetical protein
MANRRFCIDLTGVILGALENEPNGASCTRFRWLGAEKWLGENCVAFARTAPN